MTTQADKAQTFSRLHEEGTFVMPNFWDMGSAVLLERLEFKALATTSAGFAQSLGRLDGQVSLEEKLDHCRQTATVTTVPISVDFEQGFADAPDQAAANLMRLTETGVVGASIEDYSGRDIYPLSLGVERIQACAEALTRLDFKFTLTARAENLIRGVQDLNDSIARLNAYAAAGADVVYAPGLAGAEQVKAVLDEVDKPLNVLFALMPNVSMAQYAQLGVRRISLGGALANHAIGATLQAAHEMLEAGTFGWVANAASGKAIRQLLG